MTLEMPLESISQDDLCFSIAGDIDCANAAIAAGVPSVISGQPGEVEDCIRKTKPRRLEISMVLANAIKQH